MNIKTFEMMTTQHFQGMVSFKNTGGYVVVDHGDSPSTYTFTTTDIKDQGNFLVSFLHSKGYEKPRIELDGQQFEYVTPQQECGYPRTIGYYVVFDDGSRTIKFDDTDNMLDVANHLKNLSVYDFAMNTTIYTSILYCRNEAINEILNHNQVPIDVVKKYKMVEKLQEKILKGHTHIPDKLSGSKFNYFGNKIPDNYQGLKHYITIP